MSASEEGTSPGDDALCEALHDGCLPHPGLPNQNWVVLRPSAKNLDHAPDLLIVPDHRIQLPRPRQGGKILGEPIDGLVLFLGGLVHDPMGASHLVQRSEHQLATDASVFEDLAGVILLLNESEQEVLRRDVLIP